MSVQHTDDEFVSTLTKESSSELVDDVEVTVRGDIPPSDLSEAVHDALTATILHLLGGRELVWRQEEAGRWTFELYGGMPEMPLGPGQWVPPYRTREKFEGADGSGDGLLGNLPDGWQHQVQTDSVFVFYQK